MIERYPRLQNLQIAIEDLESSKNIRAALACLKGKAVIHRWHIKMTADAANAIVESHGVVHEVGPAALTPRSGQTHVANNHIIGHDFSRVRPWTPDV